MNQKEWIAEAKETLAKQDEIIEQLSTAPARIGIITEVNPLSDWVRVYCGDEHMEVRRPIDGDINEGIEPGVEVRISAETGAITDIADFETSTGTIQTVTAVLDDGRCEIAQDGEATLFWCPDDIVIEAGDRVLTVGSVVKKNLGKENKAFAFSGSTNVSWDDIGGLDEAKGAMKEAIELPYLHPEIFAAYDKKPIKGILLYGPPGCGKTMMGKAAATALAMQHGETASSGFLYVKGPEILNKYVGVSEQRVRELFKSARDHEEKNGYPAIIFIDEADAILGKRGRANASVVNQTLVPAFLAEMDGLDDSGAMVLLASNLPDALDPAVVRDGRIDRKVKIGRPDEEGLTSIFAIYAKGKPLAKGFSQADFVSVGVSELFSDERVIYTLEMKDGGSERYRLRDAINGAMVTAVVENAASLAITRDLETGSLSGIGKDDVVSAVEMIYRQNIDVDHQESLRDYASTINREIAGFQKARL